MSDSRPDGTVSVASSRPYRLRDGISVLGAMIVLSIALNIVILPFNQVVDPVRKTFGITDVQFSVLVGAFFAVPSMIMSVVGGWLADRLRRRRLLIAAVLLWTAGGCWSALASSYEQLAAARILVAIGSGIKFPLAMTWINDAFAPAQRGKAIGVFFIVLGLGPALGATIGGLVLQAGETGHLAFIPYLGKLEPWQAALLVLAPVGLVFLPWAASLRDNRPDDPRATIAGSPLESSRLAPLGFLVAMVVGASLLSLADTANLVWLPTVLRRQHGLDARQTGAAFGLIATIAGALGPLIGGLVGDAVYRHRGIAGRLWVCSGAALVCAPLLLSYLASSLFVLLAALAGSGLLTVLALSLGYVAIQGLLPSKNRGLGTGIANAATQCVSASAPTIVALASAALGSGGASLGVAVGIVTTTAFALAAGVYASTAWRVGRWQKQLAA